MNTVTNQPRRHCMVVFASYPLGETRVQREAEALAKDGYEVDVICLRTVGSIPVDSYNGVKIYRERYRLLVGLFKDSGLGEKFFKYLHFFFSATLRLTQLHFQKHYHSVQVHNLPDFLVFCALIPRMLGVPVVLDLHDLMPEFYAGRFGSQPSLSLRLIRWQERVACRFASHVITVSEHWRQALIARGVPPEKCSVVMNVADERIFHPDEQARAQTLRAGGFRLVYHGAIVERYGLDLAIRAVVQLRDQIPDLHLLIIGRGQHVPLLKRLVTELEAQQQVTLRDLCLAEELPAMLHACHVGIVPYRNDVFTDGLLPTKLMEYAALGLPAIASRTTAIQAYFQDTNTALFEPDNVESLAACILSLYQQPERLEELARGSQKFTQKYHWGQVGQDYVALIRRLGR